MGAGGGRGLSLPLDDGVRRVRRRAAALAGSGPGEAAEEATLPG